MNNEAKTSGDLGSDKVDKTIKAIKRYRSEIIKYSDKKEASDESKKYLEVFENIQNVLRIFLDKQDILSTKENPYQIREELLKLIVCNDVRNRLNKILVENELDFLIIEEADLFQHHFSITQDAIGKCSFSEKMNGISFLKKIELSILDGLNENEDKSDLDNNTSNEIIRLQNVLDENANKGKDKDKYKDKYKGAVHLLYCISGKNIQIVRKIIDKQIENGYRFFNHLYYFLGVYADITQYLIENMHQKEKGGPAVIDQNAINILPKIFKNPRLHEVIVDKDTNVNLFKILTEILQTEKEDSNPWIVNDIEKTPFSWNNIGNLISSEIDRESQAHIISLVNDYHSVLFSVKIAEIKKDYEDKAMLIEDEAERKNFLDKLQKKLDNLLERHNIVCKYFQKDGSTNNLEEEIAYYYKNRPYEEDKVLDKFYSIETKRHGKINPMPIMLRLMDFEKILQDQGLQDDFLRLTGILNQIKECTNKILLKDSLKFIFEKKDPYLLMPLGIFHKNAKKSPYELLAHIAYEKLSPKDLEEISMEIERESNAEMIDIKKNFNTAGVGYERSLIHTTAGIIEKKLSFRSTIDFFKKTVAECFNNNECEIFPEQTATHAFDELLKSLKLTSESSTIATNQEYRQIVNNFPNLKIFDIEKFRSVEEAAKNIASMVDKKTEFIFLSSATRFGDKLFSDIDEENQGNGFLAKLIKKLHQILPNNRVCIKDFNTGDFSDQSYEITGEKEIDGICYVKLNDDSNNLYPLSNVKRKYIPIFIDKVQELGRCNPVDTSEGADGYLFSATKAMNVGFAACLMLSKKYSKILESLGKKHNPLDITLNKKDLISFALALRISKGKFDTMRKEGNEPENLEKTLEELISKQMKLLTDYAINKFANFGNLFVERGTMKEHLANKTNKNTSEMFGCEIITPNHGNKEKYTGILTLLFKYIKKGSNLKDKLAEKGYSIASCMDDKCVRISFNYFHDTKDIDIIFKEISDAQYDEFLEKEGLKSA